MTEIRLGNPFRGDPALQTAIKKFITEASNFLSLGLVNIDVRYPPLLDDFDNRKAKIFWKGTMTGLPEGWKLSPDIGGRLFWPDVPEPDILRMSVLRSVAFAGMAGLLEERHFIYEALDVYRYDQASLLQGAFNMYCVGAMQKMIEYPDPESDKHPVLWSSSVKKSQRQVGNRLRQSSTAFLSEIRKKMHADLKRE